MAGVAASSHPAPFPRCFIPPPPLCTFARAFHVLPPPPARFVHAPPTFRAPWHAPPSPTTLSARASHLARFRALFFPPLSPPPPPGSAAPPNTGRAWAARRRGGARGARAGPAPRGRKEGGAGAARAVCSRPRAPRRRRELGEEEEGRELKEQDSPFPDPPFFPSSPTRLKGRMAWPPLWPVLFVRQSGNTFHTPLSRSPSSVPPGPAARLRVRAKCRAEARLLGPAPRSRRPPLRAPQRAPPPALPACPAPAVGAATCSRGVVPLWPSCAVWDRAAAAAPPRDPDRPTAIRAVGRCYPRVHPLLTTFTVPPATLQDFFSCSEARDHPSPPGPNEVLTSYRNNPVPSTFLCLTVV